VGPRAGLDAMAKGKILVPAGESNRGLPAHSLVSVLTELFRLHCRWEGSIKMQLREVVL